MESAGLFTKIRRPPSPHGGTGSFPVLANTAAALTMEHMLITFLPLLVLPLAHAAPDTSDRIRILEVKGEPRVSVLRTAGRRQETAQEGDTLLVGDEVATAKGQIVSLEAYDGSKWKVAPDSRLKLESRKPEQKRFFYWTFEILRGAMWGKVEKQEGGSSGFRLKTRTKTAAMGVRGTEYLVGGDDSRAEVDVLEGQVWWGKSPDFVPGTYKEVSAGEHGEVRGDGSILVEKSQGDAVALQRHYGLLPPLAGEGESGVKKPGGPDDCRAKNKGWCSRDGSKSGDCCDD